MIFENINFLRQFLSKNHNEKPIYMTSGGFDPVHIGHIRCILETSKLAIRPRQPSQMTGLVVVVVNADSFLIRKKGYAFMPLEQRMEIIDAIKGVDFVVPWEAEGSDQTVIEAINQLRPSFFTKGGDRFDASTIPEWEICQLVGCKIITGVGKGGKIQSSSELIAKAKKFREQNEFTKK